MCIFVGFFPSVVDSESWCRAETHSNNGNEASRNDETNAQEPQSDRCIEDLGDSATAQNKRWFIHVILCEHPVCPSVTQKRYRSAPARQHEGTPRSLTWPWKTVVERPLSYWEGNLWGAMMLNLGRVVQKEFLHLPRIVDQAWRKWMAPKWLQWCAKPTRLTSIVKLHTKRYLPHVQILARLPQDHVTLEIRMFYWNKFGFSWVDIWVCFDGK